ncbi:hypothetical protein CO151_08100 [bacterium CG_4_9_14_3_um_filter_65_15]|nr:MAG: hypothetical protein CO151_08100 [bacterium CG_4_9_14_3_um_filter_65_15]
MSQRKPMSGKAGKSDRKAGGKSRGRKRSQQEGFSDFMDLAEDEDPGMPDVPAPAATAGDGGTDTAPNKRGPARIVVTDLHGPAWAWGLWPAVCTLVVGGAMASALRFLYHGQWNVLWDYSGLTNLQGLLDLNAYPQNVFLAVVIIAILLLVMVGYRLSSIIGDLQRRTVAQGELLGRLTTLRFDNQAAWQDPLFKMNPNVETFTADLLGAWRHQAARMDRMAGLEGECHRLEKALSEDSRDDLAGNFSIPVVSMIADEVLQLFDGRDAAMEDQESHQAKLGSRGHDLMADVQDARGWQRYTQDQLNMQGDAVLKASAHLNSAGTQLAKDPRFSWKPEDVLALLADLRVQLQGRGASVAQPKADGGADSDLLDRLSKLSFQIGMEVARLGNRGERLAPMAQTLEEVAKAVRAQGMGGGAPGVVPASLTKRLQEQISAFEKAAKRPERHLPTLVVKLGQTARDAAENLGKIADSFEPQYERLGRMGQACAELTGVEFDASQAIDSSAGELELSNYDPFLRQEPEEDIPVIDPFLERSDNLTVTEGGLDPFAISNNVLPGSEDEYAQAAAPAFSQPSETGLPDSGQKVYDLAEFGAVKLSADSPAGRETVHDLSDFGAVPLDRAVGDDRVYDLSEFGARRLD